MPARQNVDQTLHLGAARMRRWAIASFMRASASSRTNSASSIGAAERVHRGRERVEHLGAARGEIGGEEVGEPRAVARERTRRFGRVAVRAPAPSRRSTQRCTCSVGIGASRDPCSEVRRRAGAARRRAPRAAARPSTRSGGRRPGSRGRLPARWRAPADRCSPVAPHHRRTRRRSAGAASAAYVRPPLGHRAVGEGLLDPVRTRAGTTFCTPGTLFPSPRSRSTNADGRRRPESTPATRTRPRFLSAGSCDYSTGRSGRAPEPTAGSQHAVHFVGDQAFRRSHVGRAARRSRLCALRRRLPLSRPGRGHIRRDRPG